MKIRILSLLVLISFICPQKSTASVYITQLINNTKRKITFEYAVPVLFDFDSALLSSGATIPGNSVLNYAVHKDIYLKGSNFHMNSGIKVFLKGAYIPKARTPFDWSNVITITIGDTYDKSNDRKFASIRLNGDFIEAIYANSPKNPIQVSKEKVIDCSNYTLEIKQISEEMYFPGSVTGDFQLNFNAFEIIFTKN